jgi:putative FmdB family regulatory protein
MPLYEYRCNQCGRRFSLLVGVTAAKEKRACPGCGARKLTKLISRIAAVKQGDEFGDDFGDDLGEAGDSEDYGDESDDDLE